MKIRAKAAMTPRQFKKALKARNLTAAQAGIMLYKTERQIFRYKAGITPVPESVAAFLLQTKAS